MPSTAIAVVTVTYYEDNESRFELACDLIKLAQWKKIPLFVVDDSPLHMKEYLHEALTDYDADEEDVCVYAFPQNRKLYQGKGGALRQAIHEATQWLKMHNEDLSKCTICFTEPEKVDLLNHIHDITKPILDGSAQVVVPYRNNHLFQTTYPIEQYHSETFGNLHFDLLARELEGFQQQSNKNNIYNNNTNNDGGHATQQQIDWLFGPFAFNASLSFQWLSYKGTSWDAQMVPYVRGVRDSQWTIQSVEIMFRHPKTMKEEEEGEAEWTEKRLRQLNLLFDLLGKQELVMQTKESSTRNNERDVDEG